MRVCLCVCNLFFCIISKLMTLSQICVHVCVCAGSSIESSWFGPWGVIRVSQCEQINTHRYTHTQLACQHAVCVVCECVDYTFLYKRISCCCLFTHMNSSCLIQWPRRLTGRRDPRPDRHTVFLR